MGVDFFINPLNHLFIWLILVYFLRQSTWLKWLGFLIGLWFIIIFISPLPILAVESLEIEARSIHLPPKSNDSIHIIVLGAGYGNDYQLSSVAKLGSTVAKRLMEGLRVYQLYPNAKVITSGAKLSRSKSQAQAVAEAAIDLGISVNDTAHLYNTLTTEHEATMYVQRFGIEKPIVICTDAIHLPRAMYWFKQKGVRRVYASASDYMIKIDSDIEESNWYFSWHKTGLIRNYLHEKIGFLYANFKSKNNNI